MENVVCEKRGEERRLYIHQAIVFIIADEEMGYVDELVDASGLVEIVDRIMESRRRE